MDKFQNKYRISSARLQSWDYGWNAAYFITICTANRECYFGNIVDAKMELTEIGEIAKKYWQEIPRHFPFVKLDEFIIMPNHTHGIIIIDKPLGNMVNDEKLTDGGGAVGISRDAFNRVSTPKPTPTNPKQKTNINDVGGFAGNKNPMLHDNISRILNWYKGRITFESRKIDKNFAWQSRFYDHIIRNERSFQRIQHYIINNPKKWNKDTLYKKVKKTV